VETTAAKPLPRDSAGDHRETSAFHARRVNPEWVGVLDLPGMSSPYTRCEGVDLWTGDGRRCLRADVPPSGFRRRTG